jgi:hypothetical protein
MIYPLVEKSSNYAIKMFARLLGEATSRNDLGTKDPSRHFICFSILFREKNDSGMAAGSQA